MRYAAPLFVLGILLVACGGGGPGGTPQESFEAMRSAASSQDWGTIWELMTPDRRKQLEGNLKGEADEVAGMLDMSADDVKSMSAKEIFVAIMEKEMEGNEEDMENAAEAEFVKEEIDGDKAKVTFKSEGRERTVDMIKVDGKWYIDEDFGM